MNVLGYTNILNLYVIMQICILAYIFMLMGMFVYMYNEYCTLLIGYVYGFKHNIPIDFVSKHIYVKIVRLFKYECESI